MRARGRAARTRGREITAEINEQRCVGDSRVAPTNRPSRFSGGAAQAHPTPGGEKKVATQKGTGDGWVSHTGTQRVMSRMITSSCPAAGEFVISIRGGFPGNKNAKKKIQETKKEREMQNTTHKINRTRGKCY
jgi:hypothetical protein